MRVVSIIETGVDIDAADDRSVDSIEDGVRETGSGREVGGMPRQIAAIFLPRHRPGPRATGEPGSLPDVLDARGPRFVVGLVVFGPERDQPEVVIVECRWRREVNRYEG